MSRPSLVEPNRGVVDLNGRARRAVAVWDGVGFVLRLVSHGRPALALSGSFRTVKALKKATGFRMTQAASQN